LQAVEAFPPPCFADCELRHTNNENPADSQAKVARERNDRFFSQAFHLAGKIVSEKFGRAGAHRLL